jgi:hypothetical protein
MGRAPDSARFGYLTDVLAPGGRPAWLFGMNADRRSPARPIALRWERGRWRETSPGWTGSVSGIVGADGDARSAWAVGYDRPGASLRPMVARWENGRWSASRPGVLPSTGAALTDVAMLDDGSVLVAGAAYPRGRVRAIAALHRAGRWTRLDPFRAAGDGAILALAADARSGAWTAGWRMIDDRPRPHLGRFDGSGWTVVPQHPDGDGSGAYTDVQTGSDGSAWLTGYEIDRLTGRHVPILRGWDGTTWSDEPLPWAEDGSFVPRALALGEDGALVIAGQALAGDRTREWGFLARRGPDGWSLDSIGKPGQRHWEVLGVALVEGAALAVGGVSNKVVLTLLCDAPTGVAGPSAGTAVASPSVGDARPDPTSGTQDRLTTHAATAATTRRGVVFRDVATRAGVDFVGSTWGASVADLDGDGWSDIVLNRHNTAPPLVLRGGRRGFRPMRGVHLPERDLHGCATADVDGDGHVDLHCAVGANHGMITKSNQLWLHPGTGRTAAAAATWGIVDPFGRGRASVFLDADGDPYPDLFVTSEPERVDGLPSLNRLFRSNGGTGYQADAAAGLDLAIGGTRVVAADLDGDGDDDLVIVGAAPARGRPHGLRVFLNDAGRFVERTGALGLEPLGDVDVVLTDMDGDGRLDLVQLGWGRLRVNAGITGGFRRVADLRISSGAALAAGDADGDGDPDLYVQRRGGADLLLLAQRGGRRFTRARIPTVSSGSPDGVVVLDHDRNGTDDFLVLNGYMGIGPTLLIAGDR